MFRRRTVATAFVGLTFAGGAIAYAGASSDEVFAPTPQEVSSYATDAGLSAGSAGERLHAQRRLPKLDAAARGQLGEDFGGIWVGHRDQRIKLGIRTSRPGELDHSTAREGERAIEDADLLGKVDLIATPTSERSLVDLQRLFERRLLEINQGAVETIDVEPDFRTGRVDVLIPRGESTEAQAHFVADARLAYPERVAVRRGPGPLHR
jgi:hypothetical protein